jgi:hypothetical protein
MLHHVWMYRVANMAIGHNRYKVVRSTKQDHVSKACRIALLVGRPNSAMGPQAIVNFFLIVYCLAWWQIMFFVDGIMVCHAGQRTRKRSLPSHDFSVHFWLSWRESLTTRAS